jgi:hypothetical protein
VDILQASEDHLKINIKLDLFLLKLQLTNVKDLDELSKLTTN